LDVTITVKARVVSVRPRGDDTFGVTLGPGPDIYWFRSKDPPQLGNLVVIADAEPRRLHLPRVRGSASVTMLEGGDMSIEKDNWARRVVAPQWVERVHKIMRRSLFPYQAEGAGWLASRMAVGRGGILGDDPGLGKTAQTLAAIAATGATPAIICCPPSVKRNWAREVKYLKPRLRVTVVNGGKGPIPPAHIIIINYAILKAREEQLCRLGARCIAFDECHLLKEPTPTKGHRAAVATRIAKRVGRPLLLTGTPLLNRPQELWRLLHMIDPRTWSSYSDFRTRYCSPPKKDEKRLRNVVTKHGQAKRIDELRALAAPYILRRQKDGALKDQITKKTRLRAMVRLEPFDQKNYKEAEKDVVSWLKRVSNDNRARQAARGQAVVKLTMLRRIAAVGKLRKAVRIYLDSWFQNCKGRPLVIFAYHKQVLDGVDMICKEMGIKISRIRGSDSDRERQRSVDLFTNGYTDVFLAPIRSAGVGLNLQRSSDVLCLERLWTPSLMNQAESRVHRIGQKRDVTVTYLDAVGTVDEHIAAVLAAKQRLIDTVVDDKRRPTAKDHTIQTIDEVVSRMSGAPAPTRAAS
jgi:SWI/SNF-related matrix-associated actin-dependent regulator 1 of chromatin subfamily A